MPDIVHLVAVGGHPLPSVALELALAPEGTTPRVRAAPAHDVEALAADVARAGDGEAFVVFVPSCSEAVQRELAQGGAPEAAAAAWCALADRVLTLRRRDRERVALVSPAAAAAAPEAAVAALNRHLPARFETPRTPPAASDGQLAGADVLLRLVAELVRRRHPEAAPLTAELEASSLPVGPAAGAGGRGDDVDLLFRREIEARTAREAELAEARSVISELRQELAERVAERDELRAELRGEVTAGQALREEAGRLETKAAWLRRELAEAKRRAEKARAQATAAEARAAAAEAEAAALLASRSWRLMAPVRTISTRLRRS